MVTSTESLKWLVQQKEAKRCFNDHRAVYRQQSRCRCCLTNSLNSTKDRGYVVDTTSQLCRALPIAPDAILTTSSNPESSFRSLFSAAAATSYLLFHSVFYAAAALTFFAAHPSIGAACRSTALISPRAAVVAPAATAVRSSAHCEWPTASAAADCSLSPCLSRRSSTFSFLTSSSRRGMASSSSVSSSNSTYSTCSRSTVTICVSWATFTSRPCCSASSTDSLHCCFCSCSAACPVLSLLLRLAGESNGQDHAERR